MGWADWFAHAFVFNLRNATGVIRARDNSEDPLLTFGESPSQRRTGWQARANALIRPTPDGFHIHLRRRLDRWTIELLPGRRPAHFIRNMNKLAGVVPPRVLVSTLRTCWDG